MTMKTLTITISLLSLLLYYPSISFSGHNIPAWNPSIDKNFSFQVKNIAGECGPAESEVCMTCHDLTESAPDPDMKQILEPTHGRGVYRLSASEYLSIDMHTYSIYLKPKCTVCHFNPKITKEELKSFNYATLGDRLCYRCHQDKAPPKYRDNVIMEASKKPEENPIMVELKERFFAQRESVLEYRRRLKLD